MCKIMLNNELNGVEMYFEGKPERPVLNDLKSVGFRWNGKKVCWYAKQSEATLAKAQEYGELTTDSTSIKAVNKIKKTTKKVVKKLASLWDRVQFKEGNADTSEYSWRFVGSNYTGLSCKDTAKEIRKILKKQFPEVKFSVTSSYSHVDINIKQSPYCWEKLEYDINLSCSAYRKYEKEHNKELLAIKDYCIKLLSSYNYDDSDSMTDYFNCHFYSDVTIDYNYIQLEQTEEQKKDIIDFRNKLEEQAKAEEERKELEYQKYLQEQEEKNKQYELRVAREKQETEIINNNIKVIDLKDNEEYFIKNSLFANLNKNATLAEYQEEIEKKDYYFQNCKVSREVYFQTQESLEYFSNLLLSDFDFLQGTGGSNTDDTRIKSITDYYNMTKEERKSVKWYSEKCVAIYFNGKLQFVIDAQGYSYARYVGLIDNNTIIEKKHEIKQLISNEEIKKLQSKANTLIDISSDIITNNSMVKTWNTDNWKEYKELIKQQLKKYSIKLSKSIIQQIPAELDTLKTQMYKLLTEVDGIQEQFKNSNIKIGDKVTLIYLNDFGMMCNSKVKINNIEYTSYAQYDKAIKLTFTPAGKRKQYYNYFYKELLIYKGWLDLPTEVLHTVEKKGDMTITNSKYLSCDHAQYDEILKYFKKQGQKPIINTYKPDFD